jgi:hypothetical protein
MGFSLVSLGEVAGQGHIVTAVPSSQLPSCKGSLHFTLGLYPHERTQILCPYLWRRQVRDAILETDGENKVARAVSAERAIFMRLIEGVADPDEQLAIQYALCDVKVLLHRGTLEPLGSVQ